MRAAIYNETKEVLLQSNYISKVLPYSSKALTNHDIISKQNITALIQISDMPYDELSGTAQVVSQGQIMVHIFNKDITGGEGEEIFDISQDVNKYMAAAGFRRKNENTGFTGDTLSDWVITYEMPRFVDKDMVPTQETTPKSGLTPEIKK